MSTIRAGTISNVAGTGSPDITGGELCRARFNLNGTGTIAVRDSFNVSSVVDNGTGDYTANWGTAFPNIDYTGCTASWGGAVYSVYGAGYAFAVGSARTVAFVAGGSATDISHANLSAFGDKP